MYLAHEYINETDPYVYNMTVDELELAAYRFQNEKKYRILL